MTHTSLSPPVPLRTRLDEIIDTHGLFPVLRALATRPFRRRPAVPHLGLNAHLRRDIGLEPVEPGGWPRDPLLRDPLLRGLPALHPLAGRGGGG